MHQTIKVGIMQRNRTINDNLLHWVMEYLRGGLRQCIECHGDHLQKVMFKSNLWTFNCYHNVSDSLKYLISIPSHCHMPLCAYAHFVSVILHTSLCSSYCYWTKVSNSPVIRTCGRCCKTQGCNINRGYFLLKIRDVFLMNNSVFPFL